MLGTSVRLFSGIISRVPRLPAELTHQQVTLMLMLEVESNGIRLWDRPRQCCRVKSRTANGGRFLDESVAYRIRPEDITMKLQHECLLFPIILSVVEAADFCFFPNE